MAIATFGLKLPWLTTQSFFCDELKLMKDVSIMRSSYGHSLFHTTFDRKSRELEKLQKSWMIEPVYFSVGHTKSPIVPKIMR